ncbi:MAG: hypothetical protein KR126chlam6_00452 [Candidatus Anoxychlamydiales bacterium]|nr:hypothetical protein [Candidatus Anoxychlamydiales bacterium]
MSSNCSLYGAIGGVFLHALYKRQVYDKRYKKAEIKMSNEPYKAYTALFIRSVTAYLLSENVSLSTKPLELAIGALLGIGAMEVADKVSDVTNAIWRLLISSSDNTSIRLS